MYIGTFSGFENLAGNAGLAGVKQLGLSGVS